jgi:bifunctional UDP-N-acetylglucosamine pyrophosphorylase/glucosamine-1-phosphate N-acetyltransferase
MQVSKCRVAPSSSPRNRSAGSSDPRGLAPTVLIWKHGCPSTLDGVLAQTTKTARSLALVVLAAGKGKRLRSSMPKVLHPICGKPILWHAVHAGLAARPSKIVIVVGQGADDVVQTVSSWGLKPAPIFVEQAEQLGTGHAVMITERAVGKVDDVLVANGDFDPVTPDDVRALVRRHRHSKGAAALISTELMNPGGYGRVIRAGARVVRVVERADATAAERAIREVATNWIAFRRADLFATLPLLDRENRQREFYLNRVIPILLDKGERISAMSVDTGGAMGANSRGGLAAVERVVRERVNARHLERGVTLVDPATTYIDVGVTIGRDTVIRPLSFLEGDTRIGARCQIGPSTRIVDSRVGDGTEITFAVVLGSRIGGDATVGPFARLRPGSMLADGSKAGTFVDVKNATIGRGSKVPHLSYVGDATLGEDVNVGAGTITVNYDGYDKHRTMIGDGARIGSDTMLVAPVRIGPNANTGAGSVITKDVPAGALAVERGEQRVVRGYRERKDDEHRVAGRKTRKRRAKS